MTLGLSWPMLLASAARGAAILFDADMNRVGDIVMRNIRRPARKRKERADIEAQEKSASEELLGAYEAFTSAR